jgi:hypothetical protein
MSHGTTTFAQIRVCSSYWEMNLNTVRIQAANLKVIRIGQDGVLALLLLNFAAAFTALADDEDDEDDANEI